MENAADALIMAGAIFVLVIILSVTVFAFSNARQSLDNITALTDKESLAVEGDENYYYVSTDGNSNVARNVGMETVIPAMYRVFYENYKIQFDFKNDDYYLYIDGKGNKKTTLDLDSPELKTLVDSKKREDFINAILYHTYNGSNSLSSFNTDFQENNIKINNDIVGLVEYVGSRIFTEELGTYYIEDENSKEQNIEDYGETYGKIISNINRTTKRVITYTIHE